MGDNTRPRAGDQPGSLEEKRDPGGAGDLGRFGVSKDQRISTGVVFPAKPGRHQVARASDHPAAAGGPEATAIGVAVDGGFDCRFELMGRRVRVCSVDLGQEWRGSRGLERAGTDSSRRSTIRQLRCLRRSAAPGRFPRQAPAKRPSPHPRPRREGIGHGESRPDHEGRSVIRRSS